MKPFAALCTAVLIAPAASFAADKPGTSPQQTLTGQSLTGAPAPNPGRLDFGVGHDGDTKKLTVRVVVPAAGDVEGKIADPDFRIAEMRMGPGAPAPTPIPGRGAPPAPTAPDYVPANRTTVAPFKLRAAAGATAELDVVYAPKTGGNAVRDGSLAITGPGPMLPWLVKVTLHGTYVPPALVGMPAEIKIIEPASTVDLPVTIDGVADHDIVGHFVLTQQPGNVSFPVAPVSVPRGHRVTTTIPLKLTNNWYDNGYKPGGYLLWEFRYDQAVVSVQTHLTAYQKSKTIDWGRWYADSSPKCDGLPSTSFVIFRPDGHFDLQFAWDAQAYTEDPSRAVLVAFRYKGSVLAEGIFPRTQQSTVYFKGMYPTRFRVSYTGGPQYTDIIDNMTLVDFTCKAVPASTHF